MPADPHWLPSVRSSSWTEFPLKMMQIDSHAYKVVPCTWQSRNGLRNSSVSVSHSDTDGVRSPLLTGALTAWASRMAELSNFLMILFSGRIRIRVGVLIWTVRSDDVWAPAQFGHGNHRLRSVRFLLPQAQSPWKLHTDAVAVCCQNRLLMCSYALHSAPLPTPKLTAVVWHLSIILSDVIQFACCRLPVFEAGRGPATQPPIANMGFRFVLSQSFHLNTDCTTLSWADVFRFEWDYWTRLNRTNCTDDVGFLDCFSPVKFICVLMARFFFILLMFRGIWLSSLESRLENLIRTTCLNCHLSQLHDLNVKNWCNFLFKFNFSDEKHSAVEVK